MRRRVPVVVLVVTLAAWLASDVLYGSSQFVAPLVAVYSVAAHRGRPVSVYAGAATAVAMTVLFLDESDHGNLEIAGLYGMFTAAWLLGDNLRTRRAVSARAGGTSGASGA